MSADNKQTSVVKNKEHAKSNCSQIFSYTGYGVDKLLRLCSARGLNTGMARWVNWPVEVYSFGRHIREYAHYPAYLPLHVYSDHGAGPYWCNMPPNELNSGAYCQFYHSPENVKEFRKLSSRPCYTMLSPFVYYRRSRGVEKAPDARGTLVFHSHSTPGYEVDTEMESYQRMLRELPEKYKPICISMHMHDIQKGRHEEFIRNGFPVYTAGNASDYRFAERFYEVLRHFRYATSNSIGSYTFYAVEMGIPFFLAGTPPELFNHSDPNCPPGAIDIEHNRKYQAMCRLFEARNDQVTPEQKAFVEYHLGIHDCVTPEEMHRLLWEAYRAQGNPLLDLWFQVNPLRYLQILYRYFRNI